jgi:hypothetical protein
VGLALTTTSLDNITMSLEMVDVDGKLSMIVIVDETSGELCLF